MVTKSRDAALAARIFCEYSHLEQPDKNNA